MPSPTTTERRKPIINLLNHFSTIECSKVNLRFCIVFSVLLCSIWMIFTLPVVVFHIRDQHKYTAIYTPSLLDSKPTPQEAINTSTYKLVSNKNATLNCSQGFTISQKTGHCTPVCGEWKELSQNTVLTFNTINTILFTIHTIGGIAALSLSCYNYKIMFKFPPVLLVYYLLVHLSIDLLRFVTSIGKDSLLCLSFDLLQSTELSTPFCSFLGAAIVYLYTMRGCWWFSHTVAIFWSVWFPIHTRQLYLSGYDIKIIHIVTIAAALILPTIPVVILFGTGGYVLSSFTVSLSTCVARNLTVALYVFVLPVCIIVPVGVSLNLLTVWKLLRMRLHPKQGNTFIAEFKLLCFFFYYSIATICGLTLLTIQMRNFHQNQTLYNDYFVCESFGIDPDSSCVLEVDGYRDQALSVAFNALSTFVPYIILIYIIPVEKVIKKLRMWRSRLTKAQNRDN